MTIDLSKTVFVNDIFSTMLPDGSSLVLNTVNEELITDSYEQCNIKGINIVIIDTDDNYITCPCVIGIGNDLLKINTEYKEYEGKVLSPDNMAYCTIEVYE